MFSSKTKEESGPSCTSAGPTFADFKEDWGDTGPSFLVNIRWLSKLLRKKQLHSIGFPCFLKLLMFLPFLVGVKSIGATRFQVNGFIAQFTISFDSVGCIFRNPHWVLWIAKRTFLKCWFRMRFWNYLSLSLVVLVMLNGMDPTMSVGWLFWSVCLISHSVDLLVEQPGSLSLC